MVNSDYTISWDREAREQFRNLILHIRKDSFDNAESVRQKINELTRGLSRMPRRYNPDKLRLDRNPDFRALEIYKIRISFYINEQTRTVNIIRLRSTRQKPLEY